MTARLMLAIIGLTMLVVACNPIYTSHDYDPNADFTKYRTYSWMEIPASQARNISEMQQQGGLVEKRIKQGIDKQLAAEGLQKMDEGGDLLVVYYTSADEMQEVSQQSYSAMDAWANSRVGGNTDVRDVTTGHIIVDLLDAPSKRLVWRGTAENSRRADATNEQLNDTLEKALAKLFKDYPPK